VRSVKQAWWVRLLPLPPNPCSAIFSRYQNLKFNTVFKELSCSKRLVKAS
jgi:hypothetical protein